MDDVTLAILFELFEILWRLLVSWLGWGTVTG